MNAHNFKDMVGLRFGYLTVVSFDSYRSTAAQWLCKCDCGVEKIVSRQALRRGATKSCGCKTAEMIGNKLTKHGYTRGGRIPREHAIWRGMITRCTNSKRKGYADYGGRGIKVCERWMDFQNFIADMGPAPPRYSIDRYPNNDGDYEPGNCRWADAKTQAQNRRKRRFYRAQQVAA